MLASTALGSLLLWCCSRRERSARSLAGSVSARGAASKHSLGAVIGCQALLARRTGLPRAVEGLRAAVARSAVNRRLLLALAWDTVGLRTRRSRDCAPLPYAHAASPTLEYGPARPSSRPRWLHRLLNAPHCLALPRLECCAPVPDMLPVLLELPLLLARRAPITLLRLRLHTHSSRVVQVQGPHSST